MYLIEYKDIYRFYDEKKREYVEMYGHTKAEFLHRYYPTSKYQYTYALSDSTSDICWMKEFNKYEIIKKS